MEQIYLDHNATTPIHEEVKRVMIESLDLYGNASSLHPFGIKARDKIENARKGLLDFLCASEGRIIFTSGGSESNNLVLKGMICEGNVCNSQKKRDHLPHVIISAVEHPSVLHTATCINRIGAEVTVVPVDTYGVVDLDELRKAIRPSTVLISIMYANNEVGTIQPVKEIGDICRNHDIAFHCDAVQAVGKIPFSVDDYNIDYLSLSGHKINAPKGIGALYVRRTMTLCPLIHGGHQELNLRAGTENTLGIIGLGKAIEILKHSGVEENREILRLRDLLHQLILAGLDGVHLNGSPSNRLPGTLNLSFDKVDGAAILEMLAMHGIAVSSGSACSSGDDKPSHVLSAMNLSPERARAGLRFSLGMDNTEAQIRQAANQVIEIVSRLRSYSPL